MTDVEKEILTNQASIMEVIIKVMGQGNQNKKFLSDLEKYRKQLLENKIEEKVKVVSDENEVQVFKDGKLLKDITKVVFSIKDEKISCVAEQWKTDENGKLVISQDGKSIEKEEIQII